MYYNQVTNNSNAKLSPNKLTTKMSLCLDKKRKTSEESLIKIKLNYILNLVKSY